MIKTPVAVLVENEREREGGRMAFYLICPGILFVSWWMFGRKLPNGFGCELESELAD